MNGKCEWRLRRVFWITTTASTAKPAISAERIQWLPANQRWAMSACSQAVQAQITTITIASKYSSGRL